MLPSSKAIKKTARRALNGNWVRCVGVSLVLVLALAFCAVFAETIFAIFSTYIHTPNGKLTVPGFVIALTCTAVIAFFVFPLCEGVVRWFWFFTLEKERPVSEIFYYYSNRVYLIGSVYLALRLIARLAAVAVACYLPAVLVWSLANGTFYSLSGYSDGDTTAVLKPLLYVFTALSTLLLVKIAVRYSLAPVIAVINEDIDARSAIALSATIARRYKNAYFNVLVSFIGWIVISVLGVTMLYTLPFLFVSYTVFCRFAINSYRTDCCVRGEKPLI